MVNGVNYFLGASSPIGFVSFFSGLNSVESGRRCYLIKGGPGTGKSSLMKHIASFLEDKGYMVHKIHCSSDPDSLDAIICDELSFAMADATAPHIIEPVFPGAIENIINLGDYWDTQALRAVKDDIISTQNKNSAYHAECRKYLSAAGLMRSQAQSLASGAMQEYKVNNYAQRLAKRLFKRKGTVGKEKKIFLSAVTPKGVMAYAKTVTKFANEIIGIDDNTFLAGAFFLERIRTEALANGYEVISAFCPLSPRGLPEHIIIPELSVAFVRRHSEFKSLDFYTKTIHCMRFYDKEKLYENKNKIAFNLKTESELISQAANALAMAKAVHDELEAFYVSNMDFSKFEALEKRLTAEIIGCSEA